MYKCKSKILVFLITVTLVFSVLPSLRANADATNGDCGDQGNNVTWIYDDSTKTLTISGTGAMADYYAGSAPWYGKSDTIKTIIIEDGVTSIGKNVFFNCNIAKSITIPLSVESIGEGAFNSCSSITCISIPDSVTSIGNHAFYDCTNLISIEIPNSVTSIDYYAFGYCTSLTSVEIPSSVTSISKSTFCQCTSLTSIVIPDSVTSIGEYAFEWCTSLTSVEIPSSVTSIGRSTFDGCTSLTSVILPDSVTSIGDCAFQGCCSLTSIIIPDSVISIDDWAFDGCTSLTDVTMSKTLYDYLVQKGTLNDVFYGIKLPGIHFSYTVAYKSNGNGTITGTTTKSFGTDQIELTIQPDNYYVLDKIEWSDGTNSDVLTESNGKYTMPDTEAGAVTLTATFKLDQKTVTFKNEDGTVLQSGLVVCGTNPAYTGTTPSKSEDEQYTYSFAGWSDGTKTYGPTDTLPVVTDDATYTATFDSTVNQYTVKFVNEDGTVLQSGPVAYGSTPSYLGATPTKAADEQYTYTFSGWSPAITTVTADATYTATFTKTAKPTPQTTPATTTAPTTKPGTYYLSSMVEQDGNIIFTIKMSEDDTKTYDLLGSVSSDGTLLTEGNQYTSAKGSAIITINKSYLDTLGAGTHKLTVTFTDGGSITIEYEVKAPAQTVAQAPATTTAAVQATGEAVSMTYIIGICLILIATGIAITVARKRKEET